MEARSFPALPTPSNRIKKPCATQFLLDCLLMEAAGVPMQHRDWRCCFADMKQCSYCGKEYSDEIDICPSDGETLQLVGARISEPQPREVRSALNKDLSGYIWPWLEPLLGAFFIFEGIKTIIEHE